MVPASPVNVILESTVDAPSISVIKLPISVSLEFISPCNSFTADVKLVAVVLSDSVPTSVCNWLRAPVIVDDTVLLYVPI